MNKTCNNCHLEIPPDAKFCPYCAAPISDKSSRVNEKDNSSPRGSKKKQARAAGVEKEIPQSRLILFFVVLVVMGVVMLVTSGAFSGEPSEVSEMPMQHKSGEKGVSPNLASQPIIDSLEAILKISPRDKETIKALAYVFHDARFIDRAIVEYKKYIELDPINADMLVDLGVCYSELNNPVQAESFFKSALKINKNHPQALFNLGIVSLNMKKNEEAEKWFKMVIEIAPGSPQAEQANKLLQSNSIK